uniref:acetylglutamate kinase n=1 Tax=Ningiella ruwaisensis TaxID=2364274 RepID=UPI001F4FFDC3|nr:acetylglutamate kinase [Ningiella ruwaisensis]
MLVLKVGGRFFDELNLQAQAKHPLLHAVKTLQSQGKKVVLVHGGGDQVQQQLAALNLQSHKVDGLRVTPFEHMPTVSGVLSGYLNKTLVAHSTSIGLTPMGLTLADADIAKCTQVSESLGAVGQPEGKSSRLLKLSLDNGVLPIIASIGADTDGRLYNVNADHAATCIAQLLGARLILLSDVEGVLNQHKIKYNSLSAMLIDELIANKVVTDGMIVKVQAAQDAANMLKSAVTIGSWNDAGKLCLSDGVFGTQIQPD